MLTNRSDSRFLIATLFSLTLLGAPSAQKPGDADTLSDVLARCGAYVKEYATEVSSVVARERCTQTGGDNMAGQSVVMGKPALKGRRELLSEFALVRAAGAAEEWAGFRDVVEVDGKPVQDRQDRLLQLFSSGGPTALQEARKIADEGARFNLGPVIRNFNVPTTALYFLHPVNQPRFSWKKTEGTKGPGLNGTSLIGTDLTIWVLTFEEKSKPTIIRTTNGKNVPTRGRVWVDPIGGRVLKTEMTVGGFVSSAEDSSGVVTVMYVLEPSLKMWLPVTMIERYQVLRASRLPSSAPTGPPMLGTQGQEAAGTTVSLTTSTARYSDFKQFTTSGRIIPR